MNCGATCSIQSTESLEPLTLFAASAPSNPSSSGRKNVPRMCACCGHLLSAGELWNELGAEKRANVRMWRSGELAVAFGGAAAAVDEIGGFWQPESSTCAPGRHAPASWTAEYECDGEGSSASESAIAPHANTSRTPCSPEEATGEKPSIADRHTSGTRIERHTKSGRLRRAESSNA